MPRLNDLQARKKLTLKVRVHFPSACFGDQFLNDPFFLDRGSSDAFVQSRY
jgi:hypothetical protein